MDVTDAIKEAYEYADPSITYYDTFEISSVDLSSNVLVVSNSTEIETSDGTFTPVAFEFVLPSVKSGQRGQLQIVVMSLPKTARKAIREATKTRNKIEIRYRQYTSTGPSAEATTELPINLQVTHIQESDTNVTITAKFPDLNNMHFPRGLISAIDFPGAIT